MTTSPAGKEHLKQKILNEIDDTIEAYYIYPHMALVPDWFLRYWDLAEACAEYFDEPFYKPKLASEYEVK